MNLPLLILISSLASTVSDPLDSKGCRGKVADSPCRNDADLKGTCLSLDLNIPDFSVPGPPTFTMVPTMVCIATKNEHPLEDLLAAVLVAGLLIAGVLYKMFSRRSLADYD